MENIPMIAISGRYSLRVAFFIFLYFNMLSTSRGEVIVFDRITTVKTPVRITVLTKSRFLSAGGRLVDIYLDGSHLKKILTGGDGYGYLKYIPQHPGLKEITVRANSDEASGRILVMTQKDKAVIIEVEEGFKKAVFSEEFRKSALEAVNTIAKNYKIIYLSRYLGKQIAGRWLETQELPKSIILSWRGAATLSALTEKGVNLYAVVASSQVISAAAGYIEKRYTFEKTNDGETVQNWEEVLKLLQGN
jgi:hypothetical protein